MQHDQLASLTRETGGQRVLIVSADENRATRLAKAVTTAIGDAPDANVLVRSTVEMALVAATDGLDLCLFDLDDGELDVTGCIDFLLRRRAKRMLIVSRQALTSLAVDAVRAGAFGYQPFDDGDDTELVEAAVRDALRDHDVAEVPTTADAIPAAVAHELREVFARMLGLLANVDQAANHPSTLDACLAEMRRCAARGTSLLGTTIDSAAPLAETEPGSGTSFEILLQRANETTGPDSIPAPATATVLLVEDDEVLRGAYADLLQAEGWRVLTSQDGFSALLTASAHSGSIHLLIAAVILPQMSGIELWRKLSRHRPEMRVLFLSGNTQQARTLFGKDGDPPATLTKPFGAESLVSAVRELLSTHPFLQLENREIA